MGKSSERHDLSWSPKSQLRHWSLQWSSRSRLWIDMGFSAWSSQARTTFDHGTCALKNARNIGKLDTEKHQIYSSLPGVFFSCFSMFFIYTVDSKVKHHQTILKPNICQATLSFALALSFAFSLTAFASALTDGRCLRTWGSEPTYTGNKVFWKRCWSKRPTKRPTGWNQKCCDPSCPFLPFPCLFPSWALRVRPVDNPVPNQSKRISQFFIDGFSRYTWLFHDRIGNLVPRFFQ